EPREDAIDLRADVAIAVVLARLGEHESGLGTDRERGIVEKRQHRSQLIPRSRRPPKGMGARDAESRVARFIERGLDRTQVAEALGIAPLDEELDGDLSERRGRGLVEHDAPERDLGLAPQPPFATGELDEAERGKREAFAERELEEPSLERSIGGRI